VFTRRLTAKRLMGGQRIKTDIGMIQCQFLL